MAFCANCGAALSEGSMFCGGCGKAVGANAAAPTAATGTPGAATTGAGAAAAAGTELSTNLAGALTYVLGIITGVLFLVLEPYKKNRFVRFHAMQSILFTLVCIAFSIAWSVLWGMLLSISFSFFWVDAPLRLGIAFVIFGFWLFLMYQAYLGREYRIPWIGDLAAKQLQ
jgi:uncharacterized membrane protein